MKNILKLPYLIIYGILTTLFIMAAGFGIVNQPLDTTLDQAIKLVLEKYPEVDKENKQIFSEQLENSWYITIGYVSESLGITGGDCFRVDDESVRYIDSVKLESTFATEINPITCIAT